MFPSFRFRLILQSVIIVIFCFTMIGIFGYNRIENVLLDNHVKLALISYEQKYQNALLGNEWIENTVNQSKNDKSFITALSRQTFNLDFPTRLNNLSYINFNIIGSMAFSESGFNYSSDSVYGMPSLEQLRKTSPFSEFIQSEEHSMWFLMDSLPWHIHQSDKNREFLVYADKIFDNNVYIGFLILTVRTDAIIAMFEGDDENSGIFLSRSDDLHVSPIVTLDNSHISISQKFLDFNIVSQLPLKDFYSQMQILKNLLLISMFFCITVMVLIYYKFTDRIFEALDNLNTQIKNYRKIS